MYRRFQESDCIQYYEWIKNVISIVLQSMINYENV